MNRRAGEGMSFLRRLLRRRSRVVENVEAYTNLPRTARPLFDSEGRIVGWMPKR